MGIVVGGPDIALASAGDAGRCFDSIAAWAGQGLYTFAGGAGNHSTG
jgi:hypothetical protein